MKTPEEFLEENNFTVAEKIDRQAMIVVSRCLDADYELSRLYAPEFSHMFRKAQQQ